MLLSFCKTTGAGFSPYEVGRDERICVLLCKCVCKEDDVITDKFVSTKSYLLLCSGEWVKVAGNEMSCVVGSMCLFNITLCSALCFCCKFIYIFIC